MIKLMINSPLKRRTIKKTSKEWLVDYVDKFEVVLLDPDGWDRKNYDYSFHQERINELEFNRRLLRSTVTFNTSKK